VSPTTRAFPRLSNRLGTDGRRPATGGVTISTCGSDYDTTLAVYTGSTLATLAPAASNDDACDLSSSVTFPATAGTTYSIAVDGYDTEEGSFQLRTSGPPPAFALTVTKTGGGTGTVTSSPGGISCGVDCSESDAQGTTVTLSAAPASGPRFGGWSGACSGSAACTITMDAGSR
jgi:hypothetical protein